MTSKSQYEKKLDAFAPYYYDDENHIDSLTPLIWRRRRLLLLNSLFCKTPKLYVVIRIQERAMATVQNPTTGRYKDSLNTKRSTKASFLILDCMAD